MIIRLAVLAILLAVVVFVGAPDRTLFWDAFLNLGHAIIFGLVALLVRSLPGLAPAESSEVQRLTRAIVITVVLGAASELLQLLQPMREASVGDFLRDAAGATGFLLLRAAVVAPGARARPQLNAPFRVASALLALSLLFVLASPFVLVVGAYLERDRAFPTLFRLDGSRWERPFVSTGDAELVPKVVPDTGLASGREPLALLELKPGVYPGLFFDEPYPDWRGFRRLVFTAFSGTETPLTLYIRIHDVWHDQRYEDRFTRQIVITHGEHRIAIPLDEIRRAPQGREMDLRRVRGMMVFAYRLERPARVYLGPFRLE